MLFLANATFACEAQPRRTMTLSTLNRFSYYTCFFSTSHTHTQFFLLFKTTHCWEKSTEYMYVWTFKFCMLYIYTCQTQLRMGPKVMLALRWRRSKPALQTHLLHNTFRTLLLYDDFRAQASLLCCILHSYTWLCVYNLLYTRIGAFKLNIKTCKTYCYETKYWFMLLPQLVSNR